MLLFMTLAVFSVLIYMVYYRYAPVRVKEMSDKELSECHIIIDVRDYQDSYKSNCDHAVAIPCGYLKRYYHEIPQGPLVVIGSSSIECNVGVRQLRRLGFNVVGYISVIQNQPCKESLSMG
jgi:rhodanese-related sulfurtransferase